MTQAKSGGGEHRAKEKRQADEERVHYKGPSRQPGGYDFPEADAAELPASGKARKDNADTQAGRTGSGRK